MDRELEHLTTGMPCAAQHCYAPANHVVTAQFTYYERRYEASRGSRWEPATETVVLYFCREHRNKWIARGTTIKRGDTLL